MTEEIPPLKKDERFCFECGPESPCFNQCCRDLEQFLFPYDVLRIKSALNISSTAFLEKYTIQYTGPSTGLPIVSLRADRARDLACPFVTPEGCRVYADRPASCRSYPLARMVGREPATGKMVEHFYLVEEPHCKGFAGKKEWTARKWAEDQGLDEYNRMNDRMLEILSKKRRFKPGAMDVKDRHLFHMACYDIDAFREKVFDKGMIRDADAALLELALDWIEETLFGDES